MRQSKREKETQKKRPDPNIQILEDSESQKNRSQRRKGEIRMEKRWPENRNKQKTENNLETRPCNDVDRVENIDHS